VPSAVYSVDLNNKITSWNNEAEVLTGYSREEVMGKESGYFVPWQTSKTGWRLSLEEECPKIVTLITKQGSCCHVMRKTAVIKDKAGRVTGKLEALRDVSKLIRIEAVLKESQERFAAIVNQAPQITIIHRGGIVKFINEVGLKSLECNKEQILGRHISEFLAPDSWKSISSSWATTRLASAMYELDFVKRSGQIIHALGKETSLKFAGMPARIMVFMDITDRKQAEKRLQVAERKLRHISENINEVFAVRDATRIEYISSAYERIIGCPPVNGNLKASLTFVHPEDRDNVQRQFFKGGKNLHKGQEFEFRIVRPDDEVRWVWARSYPINTEDGGSLQKAVTFTDITDRKLMEDTLREREREGQRELNLAARVQQNSLPRFFLGERVKVDKVFLPHHTVSGDLLNYRWFPEAERLCGYVVDVSGHGMSTALQTAMFKMLLDNTLLSGGEISADVFQGINQKMRPYLYEDAFAGLLYFEFDFKQMLLKVISAGISLFLAAKPDKCELVSVSGGLMGIFDRADVGTFSMPFARGEVYCMMSDGLADIIEASQVQAQKGFTAYKLWLERLGKSSARQDDCSCICIEILEENKRVNVLTIQDYSELEQAQKIIADYLERNAQKYVCSLDVMVNEAINNGLRAGGCVRVTSRRVGNIIIIRVKDDGCGFPVSDVMDKLNKLSEEDLDAEFEARQLAEGGRGMLIMKMFSDRIVYNKQGNEVLLMKRLN
jgi:PAS domain S-box-containing protein